MQQTVQSAAPGSLWTGGGAASYADANIKHANVLGSLADLDKRLGTEVDRSATIVANGRRDLAAVRKWVVERRPPCRTTLRANGCCTPS